MAEIKNRIDALFGERVKWESLWDTAYTYIAPERAQFFRSQQDPGSIQSQVFDSTAIDSAERLANLLLTGTTPPWQRWFRLMPGNEVREQEDRTQLQPLLQEAEDKVYQLLQQGGFYTHMQLVLMDRIVGGTASMEATPGDSGVTFHCAPLSEIAVAEDAYGRICEVARRNKWSVKSLLDFYSDELPDEVKDEMTDKRGCEYQVYEYNVRQPDGQWEWYLIFSHARSPQITLEKTTEQRARLMTTRWSRMPDSPYGRGPGLRAMADVRALNKIKELSLKNAALATSGVYTVVNDGIINAYTLTIEPGARIPVMSNSDNDPSIKPLPMTTQYDVGMFTMEDLRNSIQRAFLSNHFTPAGRTPLSAEEISQRAQVISQDMGASIVRLQEEVFKPCIDWCLAWLKQNGELPQQLEADGALSEVRYVSRFSQAQWVEEKQDILELATLAAQFGQFDPQAGMVVDTQAALRRVAELSGLPATLLRSEEEVQQLLQQAMAARALTQETTNG